MNYQSHKRHPGTYVNAGFGRCAPVVDYDRCLVATHLSGTWCIPQAFSDGQNNFAQIALHKTEEGAFYAPLRIGRFC
jgi:hypothetical protein